MPEIGSVVVGTVSNEPPTLISPASDVSSTTVSAHEATRKPVRATRGKSGSEASVGHGEDVMAGVTR